MHPVLGKGSAGIVAVTVQRSRWDEKPSAGNACVVLSVDMDGAVTALNVIKFVLRESAWGNLPDIAATDGKMTAGVANGVEIGEMNILQLHGSPFLFVVV